MNIRYVTIEREYGSGGTEIADRVAKECGISCYGREILEIAAAKLHISVEEAQQYEENASASEALRGESGVLRVFIRADEEFKKRRAVEIYGIPEQDADKVCRRYNRKRANYYAVNATKKWEDMRNYDIVLDSGTLGIDGCVAALTGLIMEQQCL